MSSRKSVPGQKKRVPVVLSWSGGKDAALALWGLQQDPRVRLEFLLTTVTATFDRVSMHGVRRDLLRAQARALRTPVIEVDIPYPCSNAVYQERMAEAFLRVRETGIRHIAYGDLSLIDVRRYREALMQRVGMHARFPLWGTSTATLAERFLDTGFRAVVVCVDSRRLDASFTGRAFDRSFLKDLPADVDPCGENGEFHTFVWDGPCFHRPVSFALGEAVHRDGFDYVDLVPTSSSP